MIVGLIFYCFWSELGLYSTNGAQISLDSDLICSIAVLCKRQGDHCQLIEELQLKHCFLCVILSLMLKVLKLKLLQTIEGALKLSTETTKKILQC